MSAKSDMYKECDHIKRTMPDATVDPDLSEKLALNYRTIPTFEKTVFDEKYTKHYSLETNEFLKCRWKVYREKFSDKVFAPFQFPDIGDLHFHLGQIRFLPELSVCHITDFKMKMNCGPGVDARGQMPIPFELQMKRGPTTVQGKTPGKGKTTSKGKTKETPKTTKKGDRKKKTAEKTTQANVDKKA